ncbi:ATPase [Aureococcus anophagefferens]|nr:ATPase [Aureococcus anophagefferens]
MSQLRVVLWRHALVRSRTTWSSSALHPALSLCLAAAIYRTAQLASEGWLELALLPLGALMPTAERVVALAAERSSGLVDVLRVMGLRGGVYELGWAADACGVGAAVAASVALAAQFLQFACAAAALKAPAVASRAACGAAARPAATGVGRRRDGDRRRRRSPRQALRRRRRAPRHDVCLRAVDDLRLLGPNGAGKTTTVGCLTGLVDPDAGAARVFGRDARAAHGLTGLCGQRDSALLETLTAREHVAFYASLKGGARDDAVLRALGLARDADRVATELSGGGKRKLSVAVALCGGSRFVVLDEPSAGLDALARRALWDALRRAKAGRCVLLTTHHLDEAAVLGAPSASPVRGFVAKAARPSSGGPTARATRRFSSSASPARSAPGAPRRPPVRPKLADGAVAAEAAAVAATAPGARPLVVDGLGHAYGGGPDVLRGVSFRVAAGECFGLLGCNGAGKSTIISSALGFLAPRAGAVALDGRSVGVVPQAALFDDLDCRAHVDALAALRGFAGGRSALVDGVLDALALPKHGRASTLSGGTRRRLSVALSLVGDPRVVLLDEPSNGLDPRARRDLWNVVRATRARRAVVLTTHDMGEVEALCDRAAVLVAGAFEALGTVAGLKDALGDTYDVTATSTGAADDVHEAIVGIFPGAVLEDATAGAYRARRAAPRARSRRPSTPSRPTAAASSTTTPSRCPPWGHLRQHRQAGGRARAEGKHFVSHNLELREIELG